MAEKYYDSSIKISSSFGVGARVPLDARTVCDTINDMNNIPDTRKYEGLKVYVIENKKEYRYNGSEFILLSTDLVIDNLESDLTDVGLSAKQGKVLKSLIDKLETASGNLNTLITEVKQELLNTINENDESYTSKFNEIDSKLDAINDSITELKNSDKTINEKIDSLEKIVNTINESITSITNDIESNSQKIQSIEQKNAEQDSDISSIKQKNTEQDSKIQSIEQKNNSFETDISSIKQKNTEQDSKIQSIEQKNTEQDSKIQSIEQKNTEQDSKIQSIEESLSTSEIGNGKIKINETDSLGYLSDKLISGESNINDGVFKVDYKNEDGKYKSTVNVPIIAWEKL